MTETEESKLCTKEVPLKFQTPLNDNETLDLDFDQYVSIRKDHSLILMIPSANIIGHASPSKIFSNNLWFNILLDHCPLNVFFFESEWELNNYLR